MLTYKTGAAGSPLSAQSMAKHLKTQTLPPEKAGLAAYYQHPGTPRVEDQDLEQHSQTFARVRIDTHPELAARLGVNPLKPLSEEQLAHILNGQRADGEDVPGKSKRKTTQPLTELLQLSPDNKPKRHELEHILAGRAADGSALVGSDAKTATRRFLRKFGAKSNNLTDEQRENLLSGRMANGSPISWHDYRVRVDSSSARIAYVDLTFSAPKSFSVAWARADTEAERNILDQAFSDAADEMMEYVLKDIGQARKGDGAKGGYSDGHVTYIACDHYASRPTLEIIQRDSKGRPWTEIVTAKDTDGRVAGDPQRHRHFIVPNTVMADDGRMVGLDLQRMDDKVKEWGALGQAFLARNLRRNGVEVGLDRNTGLSYLPAIPRWVCDAYSKRTKNGTEAAREYAKSQGVDWDILTADRQKALLKLNIQGNPRQPKIDDMSDWDAWDEQDRRTGYKHQSVLRPEAPAHVYDREVARKVSLEMLEKELERRADLSGGDLRLAAIQGHIEAGIETAADINATTKAMRDQGVRQDGEDTSLIWGTVSVKGRERVRATTALHEQREIDLIALAQAGWKDRSGALTQDQVDQAVAHFTSLPEGEGKLRFDGEHGQAQKAAMDALGTGGRVSIAIGAAGSGKTTLLKPLVRGWKAAGRDVHGIALAWRQADNLTGAGIGGRQARAVAKFMHPAIQETLKLTDKSVVVVDEIGLLGTKDLLALMKLREEKGFTLVMLGDPKQCASIEAGPVITLLEKALGEDAVPKILTTIRQRSDREKEIASMWREGRAGDALVEKAKDKQLHIVPGDYVAAVRHVAKVWQDKVDANRGRKDWTVSVSAPTNADAREISREIRQLCKSRGLLSGQELNLSSVDQYGVRYDLPIAVGDKLRLFQTTRVSFGNGKSGTLGRNASIVEIVAIHEGKKGGLILRNEHGTTGFVTWDSLREKQSQQFFLNYGYVLTTFSAQSSTVTSHIYAMPAGSRAVQGFEAYVSATRHTDDLEVITSDGAERRDIRDRRPIGDQRPVREWDVLDNMGRNLSRQPEKVSALAMLEKARNVRRGFARALQEGLRRGQRREADGLAPSTLEQTFAQRREEEAVGQVIEQVQEAVREQRAVIEAAAALPKQVERVVDRAVEFGMHPRPQRDQQQPRPERTAPAFTESPARQFGDVLRDAGFLLQGDPIMDGKIHTVAVTGNRGREKSGSYVGHSDGWPAGWYRNYKNGGEGQNWVAKGQAKKRSAEEIEADRRAREETKREADARVQRGRDAAAAQAVEIWTQAAPAIGHAYLQDKGVKSHGLRVGVAGQKMDVETDDGRLVKVSLQGTLLVPMRTVTGELRNLQMIRANGSKMFLKNGEKTGRFCMLGEWQAGQPLKVAEGYATAASWREATGDTIAVAFDAGNLLPVMREIRQADPEAELGICADNDSHLPLRPRKDGERQLENVGLVKAQAAAKELDAEIYLPPEIPERFEALKGTDWNDFVQSRGAEALRDCARAVKTMRREAPERDAGIELE